MERVVHLFGQPYNPIFVPNNNRYDYDNFHEDVPKLNLSPVGPIRIQPQNNIEIERDEDDDRFNNIPFNIFQREIEEDEFLKYNQVELIIDSKNKLPSLIEDQDSIDLDEFDIIDRRKNLKKKK